MLWFPVDRSAESSLTVQVYEQLRQRILRSELVEGERLPSSRELASSIGVSRNIVLEVYDRLLAEGYLEIRPQSGTYVAAGSHFPTIAQAMSSDVEGQSAASIARPTPPPGMIDFRAAHPAADYFPRAAWGRLAKEICLYAPERAFGYGSPEGASELRSVLARYLLQARGVRCHPEQIVITTGATQALQLVTGLLSRDKRARIAVEDPVTDEMRTIFAYAGAELLPVPVDDTGILPEELPAGEAPDFVFVIPSHQFPLGGTLPIQRRIQLIEYAIRSDCLIVEDDYDSEFTYEGVPVHSMQGLDPERVIYVGTFSKILSPSLRIGYAVLPIRYVEEYRRLKWFADRHTAMLEQLILARFMEEGYFDRHIRRMRKIYRKRRETLASNLRKHLPQARILGESAGMHLVVEVPGIRFTEERMARIALEGVHVYAVEHYALVRGRHENRIVMGYGGLTPQDIADGVERLARAIEAAD
ncbi:PLP-dependent aminotransferase family protein [Paenibacillus sp. PAMC21692]|uniref:MocR-like pyridoxine biosynthesis transcription factor PdxR n=1 Tax=Paenibacillus sp. PAMC21692 TaxID=2762320 RepID=UPI00164E00FE|nr:PLP-dependent aminotransferase family protein [Paenibacillus sp. PAMC21692]QNK56862.1 PLP-dependent aminotransferase family protein [Paenibacillus sp. PAMC21692]